MSGNKTKILVAIITGVVTLVVAYWQFGDKSKPKHTEIAGRVIRSDTKQPISGAKVSVDSQGMPQVHYTDTEGVYHLVLDSPLQTFHIRVEASGFEVFDRNISITKIGLEDVRLMPDKNASN
ncbi:MAG: carboxypeptidase-like regulatory domain-containing protein [Blastocatellia bacterium]